MDTVTTTPQSITASQNTGAKAGTETKSGDGTKISSDFEMFLKLLTTQMTNQDPLNPMKAEEFATQLATFSSVEQQVQTNQLLADMAKQASQAEFTGMTQWIGKEVEAVMPAQFTGSPITVSPPTGGLGEIQQLVVRDPAGTEVFRQTLNGSETAVNWNGQTHSGQTATAGAYSFTVEGFQSGELIAAEGASVYAPVSEVRMSATGPILSFGEDLEIPADAVTAVRQRPGT
ncbi:flagellar hook capping FlgD N-terminal domain-containing protein [Palleronia abyssalis]|uniref:Basal-body rod modification protein FlgD n=1 Tax=Palleronia abyssalis TaxID=1501240 RepID=A0A2R8BWW8_9RHOB|nr:flagellar hook capping FlgD N-terminal domain-containing protein [Palleronia abyssalis]SPJ24623.1 Basal-body rod modification protein FlgD [Palleronia abyssalis]